MERLIAIVIVLGIVFVVVLAASGILYVNNAPDKTTITIDKEQFREKTQEAVRDAKQEGGELLDKTGKTLHKAGKDLRESPEREPERSPEPAPTP